MRSSSPIILSTILLMLFSLFFILEIGNTEYQQSLVMCVNFIFVLWQVWRIGKLSPFFLFMSTFCFLFIGGHFWGCLINPDLPLRVGSFMDPTPSTEPEWKNTLAYLILFLYASLAGYNIYRYKHDLETDNSVYVADNGGRFISLNRVLSVIFWPLAFFVLYGGYKTLMLIMSSGYSAIYLSQAESYSSNSFLLVLTMFFFAMAMTFGNKKTRILYISMMLTNGIIGILGGGRGAFGAFLLFALWLSSTRWKINFKKLFIGGGIALFLLLFMSQMSKRSQDSGTEYDSITDMAGLFIYSQGESLATFEKSREYTYPAIAYVQSFIPGSSLIYAKLINPNLKNYESSFSLYLSQRMNAKRFLEGDGGGWTLISDLYLFSGRTWLGYIILSFLFGFLMAMLECKSKKDMLYRVVMFSIFLRLLTLPRTGLNYICPLIIYVMIYYYIFSHLYNLQRK